MIKYSKYEFNEKGMIFCVSIFSPNTYLHLGIARLDAIPTSMWVRTNIYLLFHSLYLFTQSFNAMTKTAQRSVTHASQIIGTILSTNNNNNNNVGTREISTRHRTDNKTKE